MKKSRRKNFTLIEVVIVIVILVTLASIATPLYLNHVSKSNIAAAKSQIKNFAGAIQQYRLDNSKYPEELKDLIENPGLDSWKKPYLSVKEIPKDPWGNEYQYNAPAQEAEGRDFEVFSYGADGGPGGEDEDADIYNWQ